MPISIDDIWEACNIIARQDNLDVCITESMKAGLITGATTIAGAMLMGPIGIAVGSTIGGLIGYKTSKNFTPLITILQEMSLEEKQRLQQHMLRVVQNLDINDGAILLAIAMNPTSPARTAVVRGLGNYFQQQNWA